MSAVGLPVGFGVRLEAGLSWVRADLLFGGSPPRYLRLSPAGVDALEELRRSGVASGASAVLARRLTDVGMAAALPPPLASPPDVSVVIPAHGRPNQLDRVLGALGRGYPVVVVDDGSADPEALADVCARHGARIEHRARNAGPGAARNHGLQLVTTELVAFLDSDCIPEPGWIDALAAHFADPCVAAAAPRIAAAAPRIAAGRGGGSPPDPVLARYQRSRSPLDMGPDPARVTAMSRVPYVPTAALVVRRRVVADGSGFDEALRYGEDVDLVWRLVEGGWGVLYDPSVVVAHEEPQRWFALLQRRYRYGTSAAPLAARHPDTLAPLVLHPAPSAVVLAALARRPVLALAAYAGGVALLARRLRDLRVPATRPWTASATGVVRTGLGVGRWCAQFASPVLLAVLCRPGAGPRPVRLGRRVAALALLAGPPLVEWRRLRPRLGPVRFCAAWFADEAAYGLGVYRGCLRTRSWAALVPAFRWSQARGMPSRRPLPNPESGSVPVPSSTSDPIR